MRSGQQNKRSRGRSGRKNVNPLSRNYESNGPDVKVRGNASHIAEKYVQLARDATASGDLIMAENYFQHAEHYFRLISAAQAQFQQQRQEQPSHHGQPGAAENGDDAQGDNQDDGGRRMNGHAREQDSPQDQDSPRDEETPKPSTAEAQEESTEDKPRRRRSSRRDAAPAGDGDLAGSPQPSLNGSSGEESTTAEKDEPAAAE